MARLTPSQAIQQPHFISWNKGPIFFGKSPVKQSKRPSRKTLGLCRFCPSKLPSRFRRAWVLAIFSKHVARTQNVNF